MLFYELVDCVDKGFYGSSDDIGIGIEWSEKALASEDQITLK